MNADEEMWKEVGRPITEFADAIKDMKLNVDKLLAFYRKHVQGDNGGPSTSDNQQTKEVPMEEDQDQERSVLSPLAVAKLQLAIVFAMNTCYWTYLVTDGVDPRKHKIAEDFERIRLFMRRAKAIEDSSDEQRPSVGLEPKKAKFNVQETW